MYNKMSIAKLIISTTVAITILVRTASSRHCALVDTASNSNASDMFLSDLEDLLCSVLYIHTTLTDLFSRTSTN